MNSLFILLGIESWKPVLSALILPPIPFFVLILLGARLILPRRGLGWLLILFSMASLWLSMCTGMGRLIDQFVLHVPPALSRDRIRELKAEARGKSAGEATKTVTTAIVILGGGAEPYAPEYGMSNLPDVPMQRLRYGLWLSRETALPVAFSGGAGWAQPGATPEADIAARIAAQDFNRPLTWTESRSRDTHENAMYTAALMKRSGINHIVLVTHGQHMPRALRNFRAAATPEGIKVEAAPMGLASRSDSPTLDWLPTEKGFRHVRFALHECFGRLLGA